MPHPQIHQIKNSSVQIQINSKSQFEFVLWDTEKSEFLDLVGFEVAAFSVETIYHTRTLESNMGWLRVVGPLKL